jgi:hypothetical protein
MDIVLYCMHEGTNETYFEDLFDIRGKWRGGTEWKMDIIRGRKEGKKERRRKTKQRRVCAAIQRRTNVFL